MTPFLRHRRSISLLALLAMLALALAPTVSRALSLSRGAPTVADLCNAERGDSKQHLAMDACGLCVVAAHAAGPLPAAPRVADSAGAFAAPPLFFIAPRPLFAWHSAQPRAPPLQA